MEIKLTDEEIKEAEERVSRLFATKEEFKYISLDDMSIQEVMSCADTIIQQYPHLGYKNIYIDIRDDTECYLSYQIPREDMDCVLKQCLQNMLDEKKIKYNKYLQLKKKFEEEQNGYKIRYRNI